MIAIDVGVAPDDCMRGECGLCALDVLDVAGEIGHRDVFFSERLRLARGRWRDHD